MESDNRIAQGLNAFLAVGVCLLLAFGILAFGAVQGWAIFILEEGAALLLMQSGPHAQSQFARWKSSPALCLLRCCCLPSWSPCNCCRAAPRIGMQPGRKRSSGLLMAFYFS
jgi:hypothetical protein